MADKLTAYREKTLLSLHVSNQLSRSQLRMGPLVHASTWYCDRVVSSLIAEGLITLDRVKGSMGAPASVHLITPKGRKEAEKILERRNSAGNRPEILGRESRASNGL